MAQLEFRHDEHGGFVVGNMATGRASYAEPNSPNAVAAANGQEAVAQRMHALQAATTPDNAERASRETLWKSLERGSAKGETFYAEAVPVSTRGLSQSDNVAARADVREIAPQAAKEPPQLATDHTPGLRPQDGMGPRPSGPGGMFVSRGVYNAGRGGPAPDGPPDPPALNSGGAAGAIPAPREPDAAQRMVMRAREITQTMTADAPPDAATRMLAAARAQIAARETEETRHPMVARAFRDHPGLADQVAREGRATALLRGLDRDEHAR